MDDMSTIILAAALFIVMLGMGLSLRIDDFKRTILFPKAVFVGLTNQLIILPIIGLLIAITLTSEPEIALGIMILVACPGGPTSNLISFLAKGDLALSVSLTAISSLITIITIPFIVSFSLEYFIGADKEIELNILQMILQIFVIIVIPVGLGMLIRHYNTKFASNMARPVRIFSALVLALIIVGLIIKEREDFMSYFKQAGLATLVLNVFTMLIGFFSAKLFRLNRASAISIAIESGIQNGTLAITIAIVLLKNASFAIAPAVYSILMFGTGAVMILFFRSRSDNVTA